jgi:PAS domain S-box-containing protein
MADRLRTDIRVALLVGIAYYVGARIGFALVMMPTPISTFWPPNAVLLVGLLLTPPRTWPIVVLAALPAHVFAEVASGVPLVMVACWFVSNVGQAVLAAAGIRFFGGDSRLGDVRSFAIFVVVGVFLAPFVASFVDAGFVSLIGWGAAKYWQVWRVRFFSNVVTTLTLVPALIALLGVAQRPFPRLSRRYLEAGALFITLVGATVLTWEGTGLPLNRELALVYMPLPLLLWAAVRFGLGGAAAASLTMSVLSIEAAMQGRGPFVGPLPERVVLSLEMFIITIALPVMLLAVLLQERARMEVARRESEQRYRDVVESQSELICRLLPDTTLTFVNERYCRYFDAPRDALIGRPFLENLPLDLRRDIAVHVAEVFALPHLDSTYTWEHPLVCPDGSTCWLVWSARPVVDRLGRVVEAQAVGRDVTAQRVAEQAVRERDEALRTSSARIKELAGRLITAQEDERRRIARELHDDVNQKLAAIAIAMSSVRQKLSHSGAAHEAIARLQERVTLLTDDIRRLSHQLHPAVLAHAGLVAGLRAYCADFSENIGIDVEFSVSDETVVVSDTTALCLYRVAQEALHNVAEHAKTSKAWVALRRDGDIVELSVRDEGIGFDPGTVRAGGSGLGLTSIEERMRLVHGVVRITAKPEGGVELIARAPVDTFEHTPV